MPLSAKLVVVGGEVKSAEIKLRLPSTIGRGRGATIMLPHPLVSRQHCELFETNGRLMVRDLGSLNGTFVNNERISESPLPPGELLTVGAVTFRAVYEVQETSGPPEGPGPKLKSGHARDTDPSGTMRPGPRSTAETVPAGPQSSQPTVPFDDDFNFELPVTPVDEGSLRETDRAPEPSEKKPEAAAAGAKSAEPTSPGKPATPAKPANPVKPASPAKPAAPATASPATASPTSALPDKPATPESKAPDSEKADIAK